MSYFGADVGNAIVNAFLQARQQKQQKNQQAIENAQKNTELQQRQQQIDEQKRQFDLEQKRQADQFKAEQDLRNAQFNLAQVTAAPQFQKLIEETGMLPPGFTSTKPAGSTTGPLREGYGGGTTGPVLDRDTGEISEKVNPPADTGFRNIQAPAAIGGFQFQARTPERTAEDEAARAEILAGPARKSEALKQEYETKKAILELQTKDAFEHGEKAAQREFEWAKMREDNATKLSVGMMRLQAAGAVLNRSLIEKANSNYDSSKIVQEFNVVKEAQDEARSFDIKSANGVDDTTLLHTYIKAMYPNAAREPEGIINMTAANAQTLADRFGIAVESISAHKHLLSETARKDIVKAIDDRYNTSFKSYNNFRDETAEIMQNLGVKEPKNYLLDYSRGFGPADFKANGKTIWVKSKKSGQVGQIDEAEYQANKSDYDLADDPTKGKK